MSSRAGRGVLVRRAVPGRLREHRTTDLSVIDETGVRSSPPWPPGSLCHSVLDEATTVGMVVCSDGDVHHVLWSGHQEEPR